MVRLPRRHHAGLYALSIIGVLASVVGAYLYLRIIKIMWFDEPVGGFLPMTLELRLVLGLSGAFVLFYVADRRARSARMAEAAAKTFLTAMGPVYPSPAWGGSTRSRSAAKRSRRDGGVADAHIYPHPRSATRIDPPPHGGG